MTKIPTVEITLDLLELLFTDLGIWDKIRNCTLLNRRLYSKPSHTWPRATSMIIKHFLPNGKHVATTHCIKDNTGRILHWDAKDLRLGDVRLWRP